jgi:amino acid transporter
MLVSSAISLAIALLMRNRMDDLATIVNFGALSGFLVLHVSVLALFARRERSRQWFTHWVVPGCGIAVVLAVFFGMSPMALKVGCTWLAVGTIYGWMLHTKRRDVLRAEL